MTLPSSKRAAIWIGTGVLVLIAIAIWLLRSATAPAPTNPGTINNTTTQTNTTLTSPTTVNIPSTTTPGIQPQAFPLSIAPVDPLVYIPTLRSFAVFGLNSGNLYLVDHLGITSRLHSFGTDTAVSTASANNNGSQLVVKYWKPQAATATFAIIDLRSLDFGQASDTISDAAWSDQNLLYLRTNGLTTNLYRSTDNSFGDGTIVATLSAIGDSDLIIPSPDGQYVLVIIGRQDNDDAQGIIVTTSGQIAGTIPTLAVASWSNDSNHLFFRMSSETYNQDNPVMHSWDVNTKTTSDYTSAPYFPDQTTSYTNTYASIQSVGSSDDGSPPAWGIVFIDPVTHTTKTASLEPPISGYSSIFAPVGNVLYVAGSDMIYETPLTPVLDAAYAIAK